MYLHCELVVSSCACAWINILYHAEVAPWWVYFLNGFAGLVYLHLDCIDGKQARRTNSSSPLGQLFDHGRTQIMITNLSALNSCFPVRLLSCLQLRTGSCTICSEANLNPRLETCILGSACWHACRRRRCLYSVRHMQDLIVRMPIWVRGC